MEDKYGCDCGSGKAPEPCYDARMIFLCYSCDDCHEKKMAVYRPEVLTDANYEASEDIEPEDDSFLNPDNHPASEHNQWQEDSNDVDC